jgi:hypothetical protein
VSTEPAAAQKMARLTIAEALRNVFPDVHILEYDIPHRQAIVAEGISPDRKLDMIRKEVGEEIKGKIGL